MGSNAVCLRQKGTEGFRAKTKVGPRVGHRLCYTFYLSCAGHLTCDSSVVSAQTSRLFVAWGFLGSSFCLPRFNARPSLLRGFKKEPRHDGKGLRSPLG